MNGKQIKLKTVKSGIVVSFTSYSYW
jgi:hypothetical protein